MNSSPATTPGMPLRKELQPMPTAIIAHRCGSWPSKWDSLPLWLDTFPLDPHCWYELYQPLKNLRTNHTRDWCQLELACFGPHVFWASLHVKWCHTETILTGECCKNWYLLNLLCLQYHKQHERREACQHGWRWASWNLMSPCFFVSDPHAA